MNKELKFINQKLYRRLSEFEKNIIQDKKYTRKDLRY